MSKELVLYFSVYGTSKNVAEEMSTVESRPKAQVKAWLESLG